MFVLGPGAAVPDACVPDCGLPVLAELVFWGAEVPEVFELVVCCEPAVGALVPELDPAVVAGALVPAA